MPYLSRKSRRFIISFIIAIVAAIMIQMFVPGSFMLQNLSSVVYSCIVITWIITIQRRVNISYIKGYLVLGGLAVTALFVLRVMRWDYFNDILTVNRYTWYCYYIPVTAIPLYTFSLSMRVGMEQEKRKNKLETIILFIWVLLVAFVMTNDLHGLVFDIKSYTEKNQEYLYGIGFYCIIAWILLLTGVSFMILIKRNRNYSTRNLSWIPVGIFLFFGILLLIYVVNGSASPAVFGHNIYNFQEIYGMMYIGLWEASLRIGLIPSNSDYDDIFKLADIKAAIADEGYTLKYLSNGAVHLKKEQIEKAVNEGGIRLDENRKVKAQHIRSGSVLWLEDRTTVNELNMILKEAIDRISEENSLLEIENEIKAQKQAIEVRNKIYDNIANRTRKQLEKIEEILEKAEITGEDPAEGIRLCTVLGAYVKRQANLSILAEQYKRLKLEELRFAIRESMENIKLLGVDASVSGIATNNEFDGEQVIFAYEIFETTVEAALPGIETLSCILLGDEGIRLDILMDTPRSLPDYKNLELEKYRAAVEVIEEDGGFHVRFTAPGYTERAG